MNTQGKKKVRKKFSCRNKTNHKTTDQNPRNDTKLKGKRPVSARTQAKGKLTVKKTAFSSPPITKTCLYNFDPLKPHFYIVQLGFTGVYTIFLISA